MQILFDTPGFTIMHDPTNWWLYVTWRGEHNEESLLACCAMVLNKIRLTKSTKIFSDSSQALDGWGKIVRWMAQEFFHALADNGVAAIAWVTSQYWPARMDIDEIMAYTTRPIVDTFDDAESAYFWLRSIVVNK